MNGDTVFAVIFIFVAMIGLCIGTFFELGGHRILADKFVKFIESRMKKDI